MKEPDQERSLPFRRITPFIGKSFKAGRLLSGLPQAAVAAKAGISRSTVSDFENGKRPHMSLEYVERLAHVVDTTLPALSTHADALSQQEAVSHRQTLP